LIALASAYNIKTELTPYGFRPADCILEVPNGATVVPEPNNPSVLRITDPLTNAVRFHNVPLHCGKDIDAIRERARRRITGLGRMTLPVQENLTFPLNGWLDYGGWFPPSGENNLQSFTGTYTVPGDPVVRGNQVLFYFIGMQDDDAPNAVNILQPVLTWGNGYQQWYLASWACCPSNITVHSPYLFGLVAGSTLSGVVNRISDSTWMIDSIFNGKHTTLNAQVGDYQYNWADVTLEVYNVGQCGHFAPGKAWFTNLVLKDKQGDTLTPRWQWTGATACGGTIVQTSPTQIYIQHTPN